jgi:hypothetical protein
MAMTQLHTIGHFGHMASKRVLDQFSSYVPTIPYPSTYVTSDHNDQNPHDNTNRTPQRLPVNSAAPELVASATVEQATTTDRFFVELAADKHGPPWPIRVRKWLKEAGRSHGLVCEGVTAVADPPAGHLAVTNHAGHWRPNGRAIRRAAAGPLGDVWGSGRAAGGPGCSSTAGGQAGGTATGPAG